MGEGRERESGKRRDKEEGREGHAVSDPEYTMQRRVSPYSSGMAERPDPDEDEGRKEKKEKKEKERGRLGEKKKWTSYHIISYWL